MTHLAPRDCERVAGSVGAGVPLRHLSTVGVTQTES